MSVLYQSIVSHSFHPAFILVNGDHTSDSDDEEFEIIDWPPTFVSTPRLRATPPSASGDRMSDFSDLTDTIN